MGYLLIDRDLDTGGVFGPALDPDRRARVDPVGFAVRRAISTRLHRCRGKLLSMNKGPASRARAAGLRPPAGPRRA